MVSFIFRNSTEHMSKAIGLNIFDVQYINPEFKSRYDDGVLGLAPWDYGNNYEENNFMKQLLEYKAISHNIFSIYPNSGDGELTHIKFGGWDQEGMIDGESLHLVHTTR